MMDFQIPYIKIYFILKNKIKIEYLKNYFFLLIIYDFSSFGSLISNHLASHFAASSAY